MSRRIKRPLSRDDRRGDTRRAPSKSRDDDRAQSKRASGHRTSSKPPRVFDKRRDEQPQKRPMPATEPTRKDAVKVEPLPTKVQTVVVTPDENNMRIDRFLEARFPGLSFSHIQRIVRKGELRVNGKRADSKDRLEAGQSVRIPPLRLDA